jgi:hypothetical protein
VLLLPPARADQLLDEGDMASAETWHRILNAIGSRSMMSRLAASWLRPAGVATDYAGRSGRVAASLACSHVSKTEQRAPDQACLLTEGVHTVGDQYLLSVIVGGAACMMPTATSANPARDSLEAMTGQQQAQVLGQVVQTSGDACTGEKAVFKGVTPHDRAVWRIDCTNGNSYLVTIENNAEGSTKVLSCAVKAIGAECFAGW